ncbi:MAG: HAD family phosphatase [Simkaniaceae bacterium]|nr:MAG: HAD family phosphatase [Simkaniaceae bacterium]
MHKGTIALDIDGTITNREHQIPDGVATYFENLHKEGWQFIFVTGRAFSFAMMALPKLTFPYLLAVQNGADLIEMPSMKKVARFYLKIDVVELLDQLYEGNEGDFIVYAGYEKGDLCYFRPDRFSDEMQDYLKQVERLSASPWIRLESFKIQEQSTFPLIKCIGSKEMLEGFNQKLLAIEGLKTTLIKDPISRVFYLILITHQEADKGIAVNKFMEKFQLKRPLITGGDDNNDIPLLKVGDVRIAMDGAPDALQNIAHIIAPPADRMGIIQGIEEAIRG